MLHWSWFIIIPVVLVFMTVFAVYLAAKHLKEVSEEFPDSYREFITAKIEELIFSIEGLLDETILVAQQHQSFLGEKEVAELARAGEELRGDIKEAFAEAKESINSNEDVLAELTIFAMHLEKLSHVMEENLSQMEQKVGSSTRHNGMVN